MEAPHDPLPPAPMPFSRTLRRFVVSVLAPFVLASVSASGAWGQTSAALVAQFRGDVKVIAVADGAVTPIRVGLRLARGDSLDIPSGSSAVLLYQNGRLVTASSSLVVTTVGGPGAEAVHARAARSLEEAGRRARPDSTGGIGRPPPAGAAPLEPVAGTAVRDVRPTFAWRGDAEATGYLVQIRPVAGGPPVRFRTNGPGPWTLPDTAAPLAPGTAYAWTVVPDGGRPAAEARFRTLDADGVAAVGRFHDDLASAGLEGDDGLFVRAAFYAEVGLLHDAADALERLRATLPPDAVGPLVHLLEARVLDELGRADEARAAWDRAPSAGR